MLLKGPSVQLDEGPFQSSGPARANGSSGGARGAVCSGMRPTAAQMAASLGLAPHPEGGYYLETYRAAQTLRTPRGERPASTAILFLVTAASVSRLHRLSSDELWVFQGGLPLELVTIAPDGGLQRRVLGDLEEIVRSRDRAHQPTEDLPVGCPRGRSTGCRRRWCRPAAGRAPASRAARTCRRTAPGRS